MKKSPLMIEVSSRGQVIGRLTPEQFRQGIGRSKHSTTFLEADVEAFNAMKLRMGEPETAEIVLNK